MSPSRNRQLAVVAVAAVASIAAGAAYAATKLHSSPRGASNALTVGRVFASSSSSTTTPPRFDGDHHGGPGHHGDELAAAASYLGLTQAELLTQLQSGKTLAQVADGTSGKSKAGLIDALVKAETAELDAALKAGTITQGQHDQMVAGLTARFTDMVNNAGPGRGPGFGHGHGPGGGDDFAAAASYLGLTTAELATKLESGKTLAQVADATSGKSAAGLVDALVAHETTELDNALKAGTITQAQHDQMVAGLKARFTDMVNNTRPDHGPGDGASPRFANPPGTAQNAPRI